MSLLNKLDDRFGRFAVPQLTLVLIVCQVVVYAVGHTARMRGEDQVPGETLVSRLELVPNKVLEGEVWRVVSFVAIPGFSHPILMLFIWYLFYLMGTALEQHWGMFRYNVFLLVGYLATVGVAFLTPDRPASATFWQGSVFLAFAYLYPHFVLHIFFILPVQIRWLALLTWIGYAFVLLFGAWASKLIVLASVANFLLFFAAEILERARFGRRHMAGQAARFGASGKQPEFYHRCRVCGATDKSHPAFDFRYCSKCAGDCCYCSEHLKSHEHVGAEGQAAS